MAYGGVNLPLMKVAPMFHKEKTYWETKLTDNEHVRDIGSVDQIDYNPHDLNELLVTSLARISVYDSDTLEVKRTFKTSTQYQVYGGCFRKSDGRLVAVGSEEGKAFIFESQNPTPLRTFELKAPTHRVLFHGNNLVSFSDDLAVRLLDVGSGETIRIYGSPEHRKSNREVFHQDYVRCGCTINNLIVSGSYDGTVKFWDPRIDDSKPVMGYDHGHSVECLCTRGDTLLFSVGGNKLQVFDMVAGKALTNIIPRHHKTITSVANYEDKYLLTGGLDGYLNVLNFNYEFITKFDYDGAQILCTTVNPKLLAIGFNDHHISVKRFKDFIKKSNDEMAELEKLQSGYFGPNTVTRYFQDAIAECQDAAATHRALLAIKQKKTPAVLNDVESLYKPIIISKIRHDTPAKHEIERLFVRFEHTKALEFTLENCHKDPKGVYYVLPELIRKDKLRTAFRKARMVITLMNFISEHLSDIRYNRVLLDSAITLIDVIMNGENSFVDREFQDYYVALDKLYNSVRRELSVVELSASVAGQLSTIISHY